MICRSEAGEAARAHPFGIGLLCAAVALLVMMLVFEAIWQGVVQLARYGGDEAKDGPESLPSPVTTARRIQSASS
jgi:hypothetical protein